MLALSPGSACITKWVELIWQSSKSTSLRVTADMPTLTHCACDTCILLLSHAHTQTSVRHMHLTFVLSGYVMDSDEEAGVCWTCLTAENERNSKASMTRKQFIDSLLGPSGRNDTAKSMLTHRHVYTCTISMSHTFLLCLTHFPSASHSYTC